MVCTKWGYVINEERRKKEVQKNEEISRGGGERKEIFHVSNFKVTIYIQIDGSLHPSSNVTYKNLQKD